MIDDKAPIARLCRVLSTWFIFFALVLSWIGGSATTPAAFASGASAGLAGTMAQDSVATLSTAWKATGAQEHRGGCGGLRGGPGDGDGIQPVRETDLVVT